MDPGPQSHAVDQRTRSSGGLRKTRPDGADGRAGSRRSPGSRSSSRPTAACASRRARCIPMQTCGPRANARCWRAFSRADVEAVGVGERGRVAVGRGDRDADEVAPADRGAAELDVARRVPVDHRRGGLEAQRLLDRVGQQPGSALTSASCVRAREQVHDRVGDHALGRLDAAEEHDRGVGDDLARARGRRRRRRRRRAATTRARASSTGPIAALRSANAARPAAGTAPPAVTSVTAATIASYQPSTAPASASRRPSECGHDRGGERAGEARAAARPRPRGSKASISRSTSSATSVGEALADGVQAERRARTARGGGRARRRRA